MNHLHTQQVEISLIPGYVLGFSSPSIHVRIATPPHQDAIVTAHQVLKEGFNERLLAHSLSPDERYRVHDLETFLSCWCEMIQKLAKLPRISLSKYAEKNGVTDLFIPCEFGLNSYLAKLVQVLLDIVASPLEQQQQHQQQLETQLKQLSRFANVSSNTPHFLRAAEQLGLQITPVISGIYQFGQAANSYWLDSTFTEHTSNIASKIARAKLDATQQLRQCGLPVPQNCKIHSLESALTVAHRMGYPVVIKPTDLDGGNGVFAHLQNDEEVRFAYDEALKFSKKLMIEKHIDGNDYRLTVFRGKVIWAIERQPAGITGDGIHRIAELIESTNQDKRRAADGKSTLKQIVLDAEALNMLQVQGLTADDIPEGGRFIKLKRKSNVNAGGTPVAVMHKVHPDNMALAVRAAMALRLDFAGVDLIMPDISKSWLDVGGGICEINAQPQLGSITSGHLYAEVLQKIVTNNGRVPITIYLTDDNSHPIVKDMQKHLKVDNKGTAFFDGRHLFISGKLQNPAALTAFDAGKQMILQKHIQQIILVASPESLLKTGLPFFTFDRLCILTMANEHSIRLCKQLISRIDPGSYQELVVHQQLKSYF